MNGKKYLIYMDILGFEGLAEKVASEKGIDQRDVREKFIDVIKERVERLEVKDKIIGKKYGESDDWLLVTDALDKVFNCILEILDHNTGYRDYERIPLEIGVGTGEYDKWARFDGTNLIIEDDTIKFYKTKIVGYYHTWYKKIHNNQSPKSTSIVLTESVYHGLEPLDRKICQKIEYKYKKDDGREEVITFFTADVNKVQQRGRVFEFLEKIGYAGSKRYRRIDGVYVPPSEYRGMAKTLHEKRILFITGTPEYGKTYTAVRLMWEYYNNGYEPRWIKGREAAERMEVRRKLEDIRAELMHGHIIYFEDPFGTTKYERREGLEREIGVIIDSVGKVEDAHVIITSREEVFKEFEKEKISSKELKKFEKKLNIKKPSYDYEKRKEILLKWAEEENCKWLGNKELKELVLELIEDKDILPTPLSIKDFVGATTEIEKNYELKEEIKEKSKETAKVFAKEIENMCDDKILFLSFLSISDYFEVAFVRATYQELVGELNLKDAWEFDRILNWFKDDKISIIDKYIGFPHPSYSEALEHLLGEDRYPTRINREIFSKLLLRLSEKDETAGSFVWAVLAVADTFDELSEIRFSTLDGRSWAASDNFDEPLICREDEDHRCFHGVPWTVARNFDKLPEGVRNLLFELSEKDEGVWAVANAVSCNFDKFPDDVRNNLVLKISEKNWTGFDIPMAIGPNFDKLPDDVRNEFMLKLSEKDDIFWSVANVVAGNFDKNPEYIKSVLYSERDETVWAVTKAVAFALAYNFDKLPGNARNLLSKLSENDETAWHVAKVIVYNFDKLPNDVRNELLLKLSEKKGAAWYVAKTVAHNFDKLPENLRNELLLKLSEKDGDVARVVADDFDKLPENVRNFLFKLSERNEAAEGVAKAVARNFDKLSDGVRNFLFKLSENDEVAWDIINKFDKLPKNVRNRLLLKLSKKEGATEGVAKAIIDNFDEILPEDLRDLLFKQLSEIDEAAWTFRWALQFKFSEMDWTAGYIAETVAHNFDKLPNDVRNLLFKLSEKNGTAWGVAEAVANNFDKLPENVRNELLLKLSEKEEASEAVARAVADNFDNLPENVRNLRRTE